MTPATKIMARCKRLGVTLQADAGRLRFRPADAVDDGLRAELLQHKAAIIRALEGQDEARVIPCRQPDEWDRADRAVIESIEGRRETWAPRPGKVVPGVPDGWTAAAWAKRLTYLADVCEEIRPDLAAGHRAEALRTVRLTKGFDFPVDTLHNVNAGE